MADLNVNITYAHPTNFKLVFPYVPTSAHSTTATPSNNQREFFVYLQGTNLPDVELEVDTTEVQYGIGINRPTGRKKYGTLNCIFLIDEYYSNWQMIYDWMMLINNPKSLIINKYFVDATLHILSNNMNPKMNIIFRNMFPVSIGSIDLNHTETGDPEVLGNLVLSYDYYDIERVS